MPTAQPRARRLNARKAKASSRRSEDPHAVGVDRENGEVWIALTTRCCISIRKAPARHLQGYTPQGARLEANTILVEQEHFDIGSDPLAIYEFESARQKKYEIVRVFPQAEWRSSVCTSFGHEKYSQLRGKSAPFRELHQNRCCGKTVHGVKAGTGLLLFSLAPALQSETIPR